MNAEVERARQVALSILKPSPAQLEHGLELHRESLVFESYGFSPRVEIGDETTDPLVREGATEEEVRDADIEMRLSGMAIDAGVARRYREALDYAGVDCIFQNAGEEGQSPLQMLKRLGHLTFAVDMLAEFMQRAATPGDILRAKRAGKRALYMATNGVPLAQQWRSVEEELRFIRVFFQLGVRMMHLTYNRRNMLGDGCQEKSDAGLSDFGAAAVREMNRAGVIVDVAHSGWQTSIDAARASSRPIVASHTTAHALSGHRRGKTDAAIRAIVDGGGTVGICCIPAFLGGSGDIAAFLDHIDYVVGEFGVDAVTIGTDRVHSIPGAAPAHSSPGTRRRTRARFEDFWQADDAIFDPRWRDERMQQSLAWTNWPMLTVGLVQRGYCDRDVKKIIGENMLRVARAAMDGIAGSPAPPDTPVAETSGGAKP